MRNCTFSSDESLFISLLLMPYISCCCLYVWCCCCGICVIAAVTCVILLLLHAWYRCSCMCDITVVCVILLWHVWYCYCIAFSWRLAFNFMVIIWPNTTCCYCLKFFITDSLEYEANLIVCVTVHFLVMSLQLYHFFWYPHISSTVFRAGWFSPLTQAVLNNVLCNSP